MIRWTGYRQPLQRTDQEMEAFDACLPPWLAHLTSILGLRQVREARDRTGESLAFTAPGDTGDRLKMRSDIMMLGLATDDLCDKKSRVLEKAKPMEKAPCSMT